MKLVALWCAQLRQLASLWCVNWTKISVHIAPHQKSKSIWKQTIILHKCPNTYTTDDDVDYWIIKYKQRGVMLSSTVQQAGLLLLVLLCGPWHAASDSDEAILSEWELWKSSHGVSYEEMVRLTPHILQNTSTDIKWFTTILCFCVIVQDDLQRRVIWESNKRIIDDNNQGFLMGMRPFTMAMNKYGDLVRSCVFPCYVQISTQDIKSCILGKYNGFITLEKLL